MSEGYWAKNGKYVPAPKVVTNPSTGVMSTEGSWSGNGKYVPSQQFHQTSSNTYKTDSTWSNNGTYQQGWTFKK